MSKTIIFEGETHTFPDDFTNQDIATALANYRPAAASRAPMTPLQYQPSFTGVERATPQEQEAARARAGRFAGLLPTAGGMAGGILGGLAGAPAGPAALATSVGGAMAGGAAGEAARQALIGQGVSPGSIAGQGALQGAYELGGQGLVRGATRLARPLMKRALGVLPSLAKRFRLSPEAIAELAIKMRIPVSMAGERSAEQAGASLRVSRSSLLAGTPGTVGPNTLAAIVIRDSERALGRQLTLPERQALVSRVQAEADAILTARTHGAVPKGSRGTPAQPPSLLLNQYGAPAIPAQAATPAAPSRYTMRELEQIKEVAAKNARRAYRAEQEALAVSADPVLSKQIAAGARARLAMIAGVPEHNAAIRDAMAVHQAVTRALTKSGEWTPFHVGPVSVGLKLPPEKLSKLALALTNARFQRLSRQSPRIAAALLYQLAAQDSTGSSP